MHDPSMDTPAPPPPEGNARDILEWLAQAHGRSGADDADQIHFQLLQLRDTPLPTPQRIRLLDLLYSHVERVVFCELPHLHRLSLPIPRRQRQRVRIVLDMLSLLGQEYFNTLADLFDPQGKQPPPPAQQLTISRVIDTLGWQLQINHLTGAPSPLGVWEHLHAAFRSAQRLGVTQAAIPRHRHTLQALYSHHLLLAIAQPASFSSSELAFAVHYITHCLPALSFYDTPPNPCSALFWLDPDKDFPAHAQIRRSPPADTPILYFCCQDIATLTRNHLQNLSSGTPAPQLGLPEYAGSAAGQRVLKRLSQLWGIPRSRRFPRRRQSYRLHLHQGLETLCRLLQVPEAPVACSEWMVTNESPDGYALMHVSGNASAFRVGNVVAVHRPSETPAAVNAAELQICLIRWAISENPEHIEIGLQLLAAGEACVAELAYPGKPADERRTAIVLPQAPPLRPQEALIVPPGTLRADTSPIALLIERDNLSIRTVRNPELDEQTDLVEIFNVEADDSP